MIGHIKNCIFILFPKTKCVFKRSAFLCPNTGTINLPNVFGWCTFIEKCVCCPSYPTKPKVLLVNMRNNHTLQCCVL